MIALSADNIADLRRWAICGAIVVIAHGALAAGMVKWREQIEPAEPAAAIVVEFAPVPVGPAVPQTDIPAGPEQVMSEASQQKVAARPVEEPPPEIKPAPNPDVAIEHQEIATQEQQEPRTPAPATTAPQAIPERQAAIPAAPTQGRLTPNTSDVVPTWKSHILALLERHKRYPEAAQSRRQQGIAQVLFTLDRLGRVIHSRIVRSSGASMLDEEALALLARAQPFPPPPPEVPGEHVDLSVPIRFNLK